jgi:hypothetical protein
MGLKNIQVTPAGESQPGQHRAHPVVIVTVDTIDGASLKASEVEALIVQLRSALEEATELFEDKSI